VVEKNPMNITIYNIRNSNGKGDENSKLANKYNGNVGKKHHYHPLSMDFGKNNISERY
jgi:hypothetical protein